MTRQKSTRRASGDDIPGLTAALTTPFVLASVAVVCIWLVQRGLFSPLIAWIIGVAVGIGLLAMLRRLYDSLVDGPNPQRNIRDRKMITRPGCLAGLIAYAAGIAISLALIWQLWPEWLTATLIGVALTPVLSFAVAFIQSRRESRRRR